jgi:hypothetical protein
LLRGTRRVYIKQKYEMHAFVYVSSESVPVLVKIANFIKNNETKYLYSALLETFGLNVDIMSPIQFDVSFRIVNLEVQC